MRGIGENHQRAFESVLHRSNTPKRAKIASTHHWTTEIVSNRVPNQVRPTEEDTVRDIPRALVKIEHRSQLESNDLQSAIAHAESQTLRQNNPTTLFEQRFVQSEKHPPTYLESYIPPPLDDKGIQIVTLELSQLPKHMDDMELKKAFYSTSAHLVKFDTHKDNITGVCNGKGRLQIRCHDTEAEGKAGELIEALGKRGI